MWPFRKKQAATDVPDFSDCFASMSAQVDVMAKTFEAMKAFEQYDIGLSFKDQFTWAQHVSLGHQMTVTQQQPDAPPTSQTEPAVFVPGRRAIALHGLTEEGA